MSVTDIWSIGNAYQFIDFYLFTATEHKYVDIIYI
jgi:hypothetical protein